MGMYKNEIIYIFIKILLKLLEKVVKVIHIVFE